MRQTNINYTIFGLQTRFSIFLRKGSRMLSFFREHSKSPAARGLLIAIGLSFVIGFALMTGGADPQGASAATIVARVNDTKITQQELNQEYNQLYERMQSELGDQLNENVLKQLNLRYQALQSIITKRALMQQADKLGLRVGDTELFESIREMDVFHDEQGNFSASRYKTVFANARNRMTAEAFEQDTRQRLLLSKIRSMVLGAVVVTEEEALQKFLEDNTTLEAEYIKFSPETYGSDIQTSDAEVESYFATHADEFQTGKQIDLEYARVPQALLERSVSVSEADIQGYYDSHTADFKTTDEKVDAQHILIKPAGNSDADKSAARAKAESLIAQIKGGADFDSLARSESGDPGSATAGGRLGQFARGQMVKPFEEAAFAAKVGDIVGPVETQFGYHIIRINEKVTPGQQPLANVREQVRTAVLGAKLKEARSGMQKAIQEALGSGKTLQEVSSTMGLSYNAETWMEKDPVSSTKFPKALSDEFVQDSFPAQGKWMEFAETGYWMTVKGRRESQTRPLAEVRAQIQMRVKAEKSLTAAAEKAAAIHDELRKGADIHKLAAKSKLEVKSTGQLTMVSKSIPDIGDDSTLLNSVKRLTVDQPTPQSPIRVGSAYYVIKLKQRHDVSLSEFDGRAGQVRAELEKEKQQEAWSNWVSMSLKAADVEKYNADADIPASTEAQVE